MTLEDLFVKREQKEFLRSYCEGVLKSGSCSYFQGEDPICKSLDTKAIKTFVVDHESLIIIFQPYSVGGWADGPFIVKVPFNELTGIWEKGNVLEKQLPITKNFLSSWDEEICDVQEDHSIAYQGNDAE